jgi:hypothetical protein
LTGTAPSNFRRFTEFCNSHGPNKKVKGGSMTCPTFFHLTLSTA